MKDIYNRFIENVFNRLDGSIEKKDEHIYAKIGFSSEISELCFDLVKKFFFHKKLDIFNRETDLFKEFKERSIDELGDVLWYYVLLRSDYVINNIENDLITLRNHAIKYSNSSDVYFIYKRTRDIGYLVSNIMILAKKIINWEDPSDFAELIAIYLTMFNDITFEDILKFNIDKLTKRHGESFNSLYYVNMETKK